MNCNMTKELFYKSLIDISETENDLIRRRKIHKWFEIQDRNIKIQEII